LPSRPSTVRHAIGIFFPQRIALAIDGGSYSPQVLTKAVVASAHVASYSIGSKLLEKLAGISISSRHLNNLTVKIGVELAEDRDAGTTAYFDQPLPRIPQRPEVPIPLATVSIDGGRMQTRLDGGGTGVHDPHWRETKNALFLRMNGVSFREDPHPELPECFVDRHRMKTLLPGVESTEDDGKEDCQGASETRRTPSRWRPEALFRTCLSSLASSEKFGRMMAAEADSRGFYHAAKQAFVSDGLPYNWTIQQAHFPSFTPILDFVHAVEHVYAAARCVRNDQAELWRLHLQWTEACWQGRVQEVISQLRAEQQCIGQSPPDAAENDPRKIIAETIGYFQNNALRMDYPGYRREGLPVTSALMESFVKELNHRVKGTEKFWNDGPSGEAILQVRAAALCDDDRLQRHLKNRPGSPFRPNARHRLAAVVNAG
jgi:hypothetical protein